MKRLTVLSLIVALLVGCGQSPTPTVIPTLPPTASPVPSPTIEPTVTLDLPGADWAATAFLDAWEAGDYETMYSLLTPGSQAAMSPENFAQRYKNAMNTASVVTVTTELRSALQQGDNAQAVYDFSWQTTLFGTLSAEGRLDLTFSGGRWGVNWQNNLIWPDLTGGNRLYTEYQIPVRANIYDRDGLGLAVESKIVSIGVVPGQISDENAVLNLLSTILDAPPEEIQAKYAGQPADWYIPIADVSSEISQAYREELENTAGVQLGEKEARYYRERGVAPHLIGYVGLIPAEKLDTYRAQGYRGDEWVGVAGLEQWAEPILAGRHGGRLSVVGPDGTPIKVLAEVRPQVSRSVYTTFRRDFQLQVQSILGERVGAIVVLDVYSGAVLAMASAPDFDPNVFIGPSAAAQRNALLNDPRRPLLNRATQGTYPLGSVFKIITMAAGLEEAGFEPDTLYTCTGVWDELGPDAIKKDWLEGGHGTLTLVQGLARSCDPYFYHVGLALANAGFDILPDYAREFGLGQETGIQGVAEDGGLVPDPEWKLSTQDEVWTSGDTVNLAIGQGFLTVTPLQVVRYVAAVANGGTLYRPYVIDRVGAAYDGSSPEVNVEPESVGQLPVGEETLAAIQEGMEGATQRAGGTATHRFSGLSILVAGKTGTAQAPGQDSAPHSWFAGYAPVDAPEIAIVVLAENAGEGSSVAAPLFRQVVEAYYGLPLTPLPQEALVPTPTPSPR